MDQKNNLSLFEKLAVFSYDITEQKKNELILKEKEKALKKKAMRLNEINRALKILLDKRDQDKKTLAHNLSTNVKNLIKPYLEEIKNTKLDHRQRSLLSILESNIREIGSCATRRMSEENLCLTLAEIRIFNLIEQGYTSKEISKILDISSRTVETHRKNIQKKSALNAKG